MIKINGVKWRVLLVPPFHPGLYKNGNIFALGCCDFSSQIIYISKDVRHKHLKKVICHELVHAIVFSYGIEMDAESEEIMANLIASHGQEILDMADKIIKREIP